MIHVDAKLRVPLNQLPLGTGKIIVGDIDVAKPDRCSVLATIEDRRCGPTLSCSSILKSRLWMRNHWKIDCGIDGHVDHMVIW